MDDMKDKMKGFLKKVSSSSSSSSSGKFKGQGRVLGSGPSSTSGPVNHHLARQNLYQTSNSNPKPKPKPSPSLSASSSLPQKPLNSDQSKPTSANNPDPNRKPASGFDPYDSLITTGKRSQNGYSLEVFECPICGQGFRTEDEVSIHVESCVNNTSSNNLVEKNGNDSVVDGSFDESRNELEACVGTFLSAKPKEGSIEVMLKLLRNVVREPDNEKFRKIRMSNPKVREAIGEVAGGVEVLEFAGFELREDGGEMWAVMEVPDKQRIGLISNVIELLEPRKIVEPQKFGNLKDEAPAEMEEPVEQKPVDRQIRVFFAVPESVASNIELPDSFYKLSIGELKREADMRKKKIEESQLLIPKSYREKQAKAARKRYTKTIIRFQFPDGVVLQGVFGPWEQTVALYEFVNSALKEPNLQFDLIHPVAIKRRVIPRFPSAGQKCITLEEEDLVPSALVKFRPIETDSVVFTGLCNELLEIIEPLV